ncbi:GATA transcription factor [Colletotrichum plurivorum]|uniref:GATA transcription factor n=1 Tax=Colletotrichum plurivorum TaxID=2175906 RepID=A0A8H6NST6_9PEZI|nr:GATA transcription factor [Colletotrichum plurivorum]
MEDLSLPTTNLEPISRPSSTCTSASASLQQLPGISALAQASAASSPQLRTETIAATAPASTPTPAPAPAQAPAPAPAPVPVPVPVSVPAPTPTYASPAATTGGGSSMNGPVSSYGTFLHHFLRV